MLDLIVATTILTVPSKTTFSFPGGQLMLLAQFAPPETKILFVYPSIKGRWITLQGERAFYQTKKTCSCNKDNCEHLLVVRKDFSTLPGQPSDYFLRKFLIAVEHLYQQRVQIQNVAEIIARIKKEQIIRQMGVKVLTTQKPFENAEAHIIFPQCVLSLKK